MPAAARGLLIEFRMACVQLQCMCVYTTLLLSSGIAFTLSTRIDRSLFPFNQEKYIVAVLRGYSSISCLLQRLRHSAELLSVWLGLLLTLIWIRVGVGNLG